MNRELDKEQMIELLKQMLKQSKDFSPTGQAFKGRKFYEICEKYNIDPNDFDGEG